MYFVDLSVKNYISKSFKNISEELIINQRVMAESVINSLLKSKFITPVTLKKEFHITGNFRVIRESNIVQGIGSKFISELEEGSTIYCQESKEPLLIKTIINDNSLELTFPAKKTCNMGSGWIIPSEIVFASVFYTAHLLLQYEFSDKSYSQDSSHFQNSYKKQAIESIDKLLNYPAYNYKLEPQVSKGNEARLIEAIDTETSVNIDSFLSEVNGSTFSVTGFGENNVI